MKEPELHFAAQRERVARYVDGVMDAQEAARFEAEMAADAALASEVAELRANDVALREAFGPSTAVVSFDEVGVTAAVIGERGQGSEKSEKSEIAGEGAALPLAAHRAWWTRSRVLVAAAAAVVLMVTGWILSEPLRHPNALAKLYAREAREGFSPQTVCTTDEAFAKWTQDALGQAMVPVDLPANVQLVGWDYAQEVRYDTCVLIAKVGDAHVLVTLDRVERAVPSSTKHLGKLTIYERTLGDVRMTEITPLGRASVVEHVGLK